MFHRRGRSNTLDIDPSHSRMPVETPSSGHHKNAEQEKQAFRASYIKSKSLSEKPIKGVACGSSSQDNDVETTPKKADSQHQVTMFHDVGPSVSKQRKKQTLSSLGPSHMDVANRTMKSIGSSSRNKILEKESVKHTSSRNSPSLNKRTYQLWAQSERQLQTSSSTSNDIRSEEVQYPSTPKSNQYDTGFEDEKQNNTPSSSNESRGSALTDGSPENRAPEMRRKLQSSPSSSSTNRDSSCIGDGPKPVVLEKRTKEPSSQVAPQQSTPSTSSKSRSSSRTDDSPLPSVDTLTKTHSPKVAHQVSTQSDSSSRRSSSRDEDIHSRSPDKIANEPSAKLTPSNPIPDRSNQTTTKNDVVRTPSKDGDAISTPRLKKEKSRGRIRNTESNELQGDDLIVQSNDPEDTNHVSARVRKKFVDSLAEDEFGFASRNSDSKSKPTVSGERGRLRTDSNIESDKSALVDAKSFRRDGSVGLNRKLEGSKISQNAGTVARSQPLPSDPERRTQQIERNRSKKMVLKEVKSSRPFEGTTTDQPMKRSQSTKNVKGHSNNSDVNQKSLNTVSSSKLNPPTKQSSGRSNSSGGQKQNSSSPRKLTVKKITEGGHSSSSGGSGKDARVKETETKRSDETTVAFDPSLPNDKEDFRKLQAAAASRKSLQCTNITHVKGPTKSEQYTKTRERKDSLSKAAATPTSGTLCIGQKEEQFSSSSKPSLSNDRSSNRTLEANRSSHRRSEKTSGQRSVAATSNTKNGVKNLNSIGSVGRNGNGGRANRDGKPKDSTSLSSYLSDISISTGADVTVASVQDSRNKELGPNAATEKLKTSHLRRLVEPIPRREHIARNSSQSSSALSSSGLRSSSSDHTETAADDRSSSKTPLPRGSRFPQRNSSFYRPKVFDGLNGPLKGDSAPITPLRRLSMTGQYERQYSIASSSRCSVSYSGDESDVEGCEKSYSERIEEENEEGEESASSISYANSSVATMKPLNFDDLFTQFTWSISQQDPHRIQKARQRLRDDVLATPLFRAMESSRPTTPPPTTP
jgi:hypothetical protein